MQLAKLGGSHDWDRMAFTMSEVSDRDEKAQTGC